MERGEGSCGNKRKALVKQPSRRGRGRGPITNPAMDNSRSENVEHVSRDDHSRGQNVQHISRDDIMRMQGYTIPLEGRQGTPPRILSFDRSYLRDTDKIFVMLPPYDTVKHPVVNYIKSWKATKEARELNPYERAKVSGIDHRFWNVFHSNFYATAIHNIPRGKICKMQYIDWDALRAKRNSEFNAAIAIAERFELTNIMGLRHDWNREVLAQFHATYFNNKETYEIHWMTGGEHYRVDFVTFSKLLGFGHIHRMYLCIHEDENLIELRKTRHIWKNLDKMGKRVALHSLYYVMNNMIRNTINPKDEGASDINGYVRNMLARFPNGEKFNVPRFMWCELRSALDDGRRHLPYAAYLMLVIERVTGRIYPKDCFHTPYNIKKTKGGEVEGKVEEDEEENVDSDFSSHETVSAPSSSHRKKKKDSKWKKLGDYMKIMISHCTYAS